MLHLYQVALEVHIHAPYTHLTLVFTPEILAQ